MAHSEQLGRRRGCGAGLFLPLHWHGLDFPNEAALGAWLCRVAVNRCIDRSRSARPIGELPELIVANSSAEAAMPREEQKRILTYALAALPARERAAIVLREIEGLPTAKLEAMSVYLSPPEHALV
jgi:RNA polymerase sigma-70 factor (ECF subfamily)